MLPFITQQKKKIYLFKGLTAARRRRQRLQSTILFLMNERRSRLLRSLLVLQLLLTAFQSALATLSAPRIRSCRRLARNTGWWNLVWTTYSEKRFKKTFRVTRQTFALIHERIKNDISKVRITEEPVSSQLRLAICLYRLSRGDYYHTISELTGIGEATVCNIIREVTKAIVENLWREYVDAYFPSNNNLLVQKIREMEQEWQFPYAYSAIDGCHIPMKCPPGGQEACKEFHNFKNFYSIVLMAMVDARYRFIWASAGWPGNSHDAIIFQATNLYDQLAEGKAFPDVSFKANDVTIPPVILGDSAFPFKPWLLKPYTNAILTPEQSYFNYRLSRARMVTECAYGQLKGRWRVLLRKSESSKETVRAVTLACVILHNICIEQGDVAYRHWDVSKDPDTNQRRKPEEVQDLLMIRQCRPLRDKNSAASRVRDYLKDKFFAEKQHE